MNRKHILSTSILALCAPMFFMMADTATGGGTATTVQSLTPEEIKQHNFGFLIDISGSMKWAVGGTGAHKDMTRIDYARQQIKTFMQNVLEVDPTGSIELAFFNDTPFDRSKILTVCSPDEIDKAFDANPCGGGTTMAPALTSYFEVAKQSYGEGRPYQLYTITDGAPSDQAAIKQTIRAQAAKTNQTNDGDFNIGIFQIGYQQDATDFCTTLDDGLADNDHHDIVNSMNIDELAGYTLGQVAWLTKND